MALAGPTLTALALATGANSLASLPTLVSSSMVGGGRHSNASAVARAGSFAFRRPSSGLTVLYSFQGSPDGASPSGPVTLDDNGDIFGVTATGGNSNVTGCGNENSYGTVYELTPSAGSYEESIIHRFNSKDGCDPLGAVVVDAAGRVFSAAHFGGQNYAGTVVALAPVYLNPAAAGYREAAVYSFGQAEQGDYPTGGIIESGGALYTTAGAGGASNDGAIVAFTDPGLTATDVYAFKGRSKTTADGASPWGTLFAGSSGMLYGTTSSGGDTGKSAPRCVDGCGTVFSFLPSPSGGAETVIWRFTPGLGEYPYSGVVVDPSGNIYGTTHSGGPSNYGIVFKLTPAARGFSETILHTFDPGTQSQPTYDGTMPGGLVLVGSTLYGVTVQGGSEGSGTIYEVSTNGSGYEILHDFTGPDGAVPVGSLVWNGTSFYGTTAAGGNSYRGTVFQFSP
jgi:uncharacterized repeat protein (TIGR03803 family)